MQKYLHSYLPKSCICNYRLQRAYAKTKALSKSLQSERTESNLF
jgi:hypothetical protein